MRTTVPPHINPRNKRSCSILAAANPVGGQYHRGKTVSENLKMSGALFSRFGADPCYFYASVCMNVCNN